MTERDVATCNYNEEDPEAGEPNVQPSRARGILSGATSRSRLATDRVRERWLRPVPGESDIAPGTVINGGGDLAPGREDVAAPARTPLPFRSPLTEDHPSPRCVWQHHRETAADYGQNAGALRLIYWVATSPALALNMLAALLLVISVTTGRFWGFVLIGVIAVIAIRIAVG